MTQKTTTEKQRHSISIALRIGLLFLLITVGLFLGLSSTAWATASQEPALASIDSHLGQLEVHFVDVGQGDAILVLAPEAVVLINGGDRGSRVVAYLDSLGVQHLDMVVYWFSVKWSFASCH